MTNIEKYNAVFMGTFSINENDLKENPTYQKLKVWDSVAHMSLIFAIEEAFDISFETDDMIDFDSYEKGKELLKKYDIQF
ncbi:hypothetical protein HMPREF9630_02047 [Peptoanaerobacter stomatis]|uniref:Acyl carrier protein n=1 Tax=Peptoanaerobacter stomatis TaxID=796937 RepID=V9HTY4_9FIRM|nr:acyl carrier protein [Peptoanaerobacter stomatis]EHL15649.1 hypothetical protein HMPREF9630_02047 [Peptoanaerobacter stomatis]